MELKKCNYFVCATTSPRRMKLLKKHFTSVSFISPPYKEKKANYFFSPALLSLYHAYKKVMSIYKGDDKIYMGFDTIVYRIFKLYHKPKSKKQAIQYLQELSGSVHKVVTGVFIKHRQEFKFLFRISKVKFKNLSRQDIDNYINKNEWQDKAGGYGIQAAGKELVSWYKGDYNNIVGLPMDAVLKLFSD